MAVIEVKCPKCLGSEVVKYGKSRSVEQRYYCRNKECGTTIFQLDYKNRGCEAGIEYKIITMTANASGIRDIARVLEISTYKVIVLFYILKSLAAIVLRKIYGHYRPLACLALDFYATAVILCDMLDDR